ncbi:MAG: hypothetical protein JRE14_01930 [Deltaproteobacteria bacterium]|nr:hypothetical protein [Deltaproteobacteria bacterium]MBW2632887.1 hypothetical protein [Deltaproteobacteria bacterium]
MTKFQRRKRSGPPATHGAYSEIKKYRESPLDMRKKDDRALVEWQQAIVEDLGGAAALDMLQNSMLDRATELLIIIRAMSLHVSKEGIMADDGNIQPCLRTSYISYSNSFRRLLESIYERSDKRPPKALNLDDYIKSTDGE